MTESMVPHTKSTAPIVHDSAASEVFWDISLDLQSDWDCAFVIRGFVHAGEYILRVGTGSGESESDHEKNTSNEHSYGVNSSSFNSTNAVKRSKWLLRDGGPGVELQEFGVLSSEVVSAGVHKKSNIDYTRFLGVKTIHAS